MEYISTQFMFRKCLVNKGEKELSIEPGGMVTLKKKRKASKLEKWLKRWKVSFENGISKVP